MELGDGAKGDAGADGAKGDAGADGAKGDTGDAGADGADGADGANGTNGADGAKGDTGDAGADGAKGDTGDAGADGNDGAKGDTGDTGDAGVAGKSAYERAIELGLVDVSTSEMEWIANSNDLSTFIPSPTYYNILQKINVLRTNSPPSPTDYNAILDILAELAIAGANSSASFQTNQTIKSCHYPECVPNYKSLNTSTNNTSSTQAQNYSRFAKGGSSRVCPINSTKDPNTGAVSSTVTSNTRTYIKQQYPMKIICTKNV